MRTPQAAAAQMRRNRTLRRDRDPSPTNRIAHSVGAGAYDGPLTAADDVHLGRCGHRPPLRPQAHHGNPQ